jgi:iron complex outermembrane receptor protein
LNKGGSLKINYSLFTSPFARDAGGLTIEEVNNNRKQARDANFNYKAGERILNHFLSLRIKRNKWSGYSFYTNRQLDARLPFNYGGQINLNRNYFGGGFYKDGSKKNFIWQYGLDSAFQFDKRKRFKNNNGAKGDLSLYQKESFITFGGYGILEIIKKKWRLRGIIRADKHYILINDYFASNNGENNISVLSPSISLYRKISSKWSVYFQYSTGYETPSLNELSANPTGETGFNKRLKPQQSKGTELGFNYKTKNSKTQLTIFHTKTSNEIIPYEVANFAGQTFYTNAGLVNRSGIEIESTWAFSDFGKLQLSFNHGKFETNLKKVLPNVPRIQFNSSLKQQLGLSTIVLQIRHVGKRYADSKNTVDVPSFWTEDLFIQRSLGNTIWTVGVTNFSNVKYYDNIRINAFGGRYFEPAATRLAFIRCLISI